MGSIIGALIATYFLSRLMRRIVPGGRDRPAMLALAHLGSFAILFVGAGLLKSYVSAFAVDAGYVYIVPQLIWLGFDYLVREPVAGQGTR